MEVKNNNEKNDLGNLGNSGLKPKFRTNGNELAISPKVITLLVNEPSGIKIIRYDINEEIFEQLGTFIDENLLPSKYTDDEQFNKFPQFHYQLDKNGNKIKDQSNGWKLRTEEEKKQVYNAYDAKNNQALSARIDELNTQLAFSKNIRKIKEFLDKHNNGTNSEQIPYFCEDCNKMDNVLKQFFPNNEIIKKRDKILQDENIPPADKQQKVKSLLAQFFSGVNGNIFLNEQINNDFITTMTYKLKSGCFVPINKTLLKENDVKNQLIEINLKQVKVKNNNNIELENINRINNQNNIESNIKNSISSFDSEISSQNSRKKKRKRKNKLYDKIYNIREPIIQKKYKEDAGNIYNVEYRKNNVIDYNIKDDRDYISKYGNLGRGNYKKKYQFPFDMEAQRRNQKIDIPKERRLKNKIYQQNRYEDKYFNFFNNQRKKVNNIYRKNQMLYKDNQSKGKGSSIKFG